MEGEFVLDTHVVRAFVSDVEQAIAGSSSPEAACDAIRPRFSSLSSAFGSSGTNTPTTPIRPVALTVFTRLFMVRFGTSCRCRLQHW